MRFLRKGERSDVNIVGKPQFRRGTRWRRQVCAALELLRRREAGEQMDAAQTAQAVALDAALTPLMRRCLELYYVRGMNQVSIARHIGRHRCNVCRALERAEVHLERLSPEQGDDGG